MYNSDICEIFEIYSKIHRKVLIENVDSKIKKYRISDPFLINFVYRYESKIPWGSIKKEEDLNVYIKQKLLTDLLSRADKSKMNELPNTLYCTKINWNRQVEALKAAANAGNNQARMSLSMFESDPETYKKQLSERVNNSKETRFNEWINYITRENDIYVGSPAFQYLILSSILLSTDNKTTTEISPLDAAVVGNIYNTIRENPKNQFNILNHYKEKVIEKASENMEVVKSGDGEWIQIPSKINDPENYETNLKTLMSISAGTPWCIAGYGMANTYLSRGDFYIYFLKNEKGEKTGVAAIRMNGDNIAEIAGTMNNKQDMDPIYIPNALDLVREKNLKGGEAYIEKLQKTLEEEKNKEEFRDRIYNNKELTEEDENILKDIEKTITVNLRGKYLQEYPIINIFKKWFVSNKPLPKIVNDIVREKIFNWSLRNKYSIYQIERYIFICKSINYVYSEEDKKNIYNILISNKSSYTSPYIFNVLEAINDSNLTNNYINYLKNNLTEKLNSADNKYKLNYVINDLYDLIEVGQQNFKNIFEDLVLNAKKTIEKFLKDTTFSIDISTLDTYFKILDKISNNIIKKEILNLLYSRIETLVSEVNEKYITFIQNYDQDNLEVFIKKVLNLQINQEYIQDASFLSYTLVNYQNFIDEEYIDKFFDIILKTYDSYEVLPSFMNYLGSINNTQILYYPKTRYFIEKLFKIIEKENSFVLNNNSSDYDAVHTGYGNSNSMYIVSLISYFKSAKDFCPSNDDYGCNNIPNFIQAFVTKNNIVDIDMFDRKGKFIIGLNYYQYKPLYIDRLWTCIKRRYSQYGEKSYYPESLMEEHFLKKGFLNYLEYINDKISYHYGYNSNDIRNIKKHNLNENEQKYLSDNIISSYLDITTNYHDYTIDYDFIKIIYDKVNDRFKKYVIKNIKLYKNISSEIFKYTGIKETDSIDNTQTNESVIFNLMKSFLLKF